jgi:transposase
MGGWGALTDEQWALVAPLLPPPSPYDRGRPSHDLADPGHNRRLLDAILYKLRENIPWYDLPSGPPAFFPPWPTVYRRFRFWRKDGLLTHVIRTLFNDMLERGGLSVPTALETGRLSIDHRDGQMILLAEPALQGTWQLDVARLFFALIVGGDATRTLPDLKRGPNGKPK